jgi:predicted kinase
VSKVWTTILKDMEPVLVLLNGIPASGKTTVARAWCQQHASNLPLALDVDVLRSMLGGWQESGRDAGLAARALAIAAIRTHLGAGHDVIVPQYLRKAQFIEQLEEVADLSGSAFIECALIISDRLAFERFERRAKGVDLPPSAPADHHGELEAPMVDVEADFEEFLTTRPRVERLDALQKPVATLDRIIAARR